ncbi:MAG TPA: endonuclease, partial [Dokdonella sp.]|nr:endonuclease [Dokdonella sp.]HQY55603.1 endonuclease [Dokdonella sp.]
APYTDTHMLWLSDTGYNSDRGNKPYANCASGCGERVTEVNGGVGGGSGTYPGNSNWVNSNSFETWNHRKGEMARAIFYMAIRYEGGTDPTSGQTEPNLELTDNRSLIVGTSNYNAPAYMGLLSDLLAWSAGDPPDAEEVARNDAIQIFQGNRNPFVDHPEWVSAALFQSSNPATCEPLGNDVIFVDGFEAAASPTVH